MVGGAMLLAARQWGGSSGSEGCEVASLLERQDFRTRKARDAFD
jgi:hypothetical protein